MPCRSPCRLYIHLAFTYYVDPSSIVWSKLEPAPPFPPMRVHEVWWSRALNLVCEVTLRVNTGWGPLYIRAKNHHRDIVEAHKKVSQSWPSQGTSTIMKCGHKPSCVSVKSYVIGPSSKCYFNNFLTHDEIEWINSCEHSEWVLYSSLILFNALQVVWATCKKNHLARGFTKIFLTLIVIFLIYKKGYGEHSMDIKFAQTRANLCEPVREITFLGFYTSFVQCQRNSQNQVIMLVERDFWNLGSRSKVWEDEVALMWQLSCQIWAVFIQWVS